MRNSSKHQQALASSQMMDVSDWKSIMSVTLSFKERLRGFDKHLVQLTEDICRRSIVHFGRRLDRAVFGKASERYNKRVRRIPILERGHVRSWHCHLALEVPGDRISQSQFADIVKSIWEKIAWAGDDIHMSFDANQRWTSYMLKDWTKPFEALADAIVHDALINPKAS
jgi:hypothetical protein